MCSSDLIHTLCIRQIREAGEIGEAGEQGEAGERIEDSLRDLWDNINCTSIRIIGVPEEEEKKKESEKTFEEIIVESFLNMGKEIVTQVQEAQRVHTG